MNIQALFAPLAKPAPSDITINKNSQSLPSEAPQSSQINFSELSDPTRQAVELAMKQGVQLTQENVTEIATFMDEAPGTTAEKLMALSVALEKQLPLTTVVLTDIQTARATSLVDCIDALASPKSAHADKQTADNDTPANSVDNDVVQQLDDLLSDLFDALNEGEAAPLSSERDGDGDNLTDATGDLLKDQDNLKSQLADLLAQLPPETAFEALFNSDNQPNTTTVDQATNQPKLLLEQTVTKKLAQVKQNFETFKRESVNQLNQIIDRENRLTPEKRAQFTAKLIDKLDNAIMKSEIGLYISMKAERDLLKQSARLSDARDFLMKGKLEQAEKIVRDVVQSFEKLAFKPTLKRVIALGSPLNVSADDLKYDAIAKWAKNGIANFSNTEKSVAGLVQYMRKLGINHEVEVFQDTFGNAPKNEATTPKAMRNLKELLLTMAQKGDGLDQPKAAEKLISHINGQQMQLKINDKVPTQQLMLSVPLHLNERMTEVNVYIKAKENDLKVDWQNFNMFFVLNTTRFNDIGVKVSAVEKKVRIDILNDSIESKAVVMPLAEQLSGYVESIGYTVTGLNFANLNGEHPNKTPLAANKPQQKPLDNPNTTNRSVDFSV